MSDDADLPKALVKRLVKEKLAAREGCGDGEDKKALQLNKVRASEQHHRSLSGCGSGLIVSKARLGLARQHPCDAAHKMRNVAALGCRSRAQSTEAVKPPLKYSPETPALA